ncbi:histone H2A.V-like isoform X1 [Clarias magur]|uniref:Histone H2A.V-like isoform X1 n=1 Tax=Clarias magur TaxID=1594786 RepID=A0A8J4TZH3_CLAMG|nr:histone H2A.V-like isoform X1 [Clarias magur]
MDAKLCSTFTEVEGHHPFLAFTHDKFSESHVDRFLNEGRRESWKGLGQGESQGGFALTKGRTAGVIPHIHKSLIGKKGQQKTV